jgi:hypothetical protein
MIDYKKLGRLFSSADTKHLDLLINVGTRPLISEYDQKFSKAGFVEITDNKYRLKMKDGEKNVFYITQSIALDHINFLVNAMSKILSDDFETKEIESLKKEVDLLRDRLQIENLENSKISDSHKKLVGELYKKNDELKGDNQKLAKQVEDLSDRPKKLRAKGLM